MFFDFLSAHVQHDAGLRSKVNAAKKHKLSSGVCICVDISIICYKFCFFLFNVLRVSPAIQFVIMIKTMPIVLFNNWGQWVQIKAGQRYFNGSNI